MFELQLAFFPFLNSTTAESLTNHNEAELQRRCQERQQEIDHMQQVLETKIQLLQEVGPLQTYLLKTLIDTQLICDGKYVFISTA